MPSWTPSLTLKWTDRTADDHATATEVSEDTNLNYVETYNPPPTPSARAKVLVAQNDLSCECTIDAKASSSSDFAYSIAKAAIETTQFEIAKY